MVEGPLGGVVEIGVCASVFVDGGVVRERSWRGMFEFYCHLGDSQGWDMRFCL